jgi:hypothetical protein
MATSHGRRQQMQVVIRMEDAEMLAEVVDAVETDFGFVPDMETTEDEKCVVSYMADEGAKEAEVIVGALLKQIEDHGLANEQAENAYQWNVQIS